MKLAPMSSRARRRKCSGYGSAATAAGAANAFAIQTPERMRAFPSERMVQPVPTSLGHSCRGGVNLLDGSRRRQDATTRVTAGSVKPTLSSRRAGSLPCAQRRHSGDVGLRESFGICQRPEDANTLESSQGEPVGFGSCEQVAGGGPERRVPLFAHARREASRSSDGDQSPYV